MSGTTLGAPVGGPALSSREVSFAPLLGSEGGSIGLPEKFSGTSSWSTSNSSSSYSLEEITCDTCCRNKRESLPHKAGFKSYQAGSPME